MRCPQPRTWRFRARSGGRCPGARDTTRDRARDRLSTIDRLSCVLDNRRATTNNPNRGRAHAHWRDRVFLRPHESHLAIAKLRRNEPLTPTDLAELERIFREAGASDAELDALREAGGLGLFVRSLVGLDREAAKRAFAAVQAGKTLTADQLQFLGMIIDHLTARGVMDPALLYEGPFIDRSPGNTASAHPSDRVRRSIIAASARWSGVGSCASMRSQE